MTAPPTLAALTERVTPIQVDAQITGCAWLARMPAFVLADGTMLLGGIGEERRILAHPDAAILCAAGDGKRIASGGDDGRVVLIDPSGTLTEIAPPGGKWIDAIALSAAGPLAWSAGRTVSARNEKGRTRTWQAPSSVRGLAFAPKGYRIAVSRYNGVSYWFPNADAAPETYEWKGSHVDVTVSPDGRFIVTSMQDNVLHGWTVAEKKHMRMSGYPSKTRSFAWSHDGQWLATSGADAAIVWPFQAKDGPMGKAPRECGVRASRVGRVAFHPKALVLAIGYDDGCILLCRLSDASELLVRRPADGSGITALAWDGTGAQLAFGSENGAAGILTLPA